MISPISTSIDDINTAANQFVNPTIFNIVFESFTHNDKFAYVGTKVGEIKVIPLATKKEECLEINDVRSPTAHKQYSQGSHANLFEQVTFHESEVSCLKVSIDNCYLASGSYDRTVKW